MMATKFTKLKPSSPNLNKGFTLVELLVTTLISTTILALSLGLITQQRKQFVTDRVRSESNQTLRVGMDMVGTDIKNTGDFLDSEIELPVISVIDGGAGPDQLILQRKLIADSLTVCETVSGNQATIDVANNSGSIDGCSTISDGNGDSFNNPLTLAKRERCEQDGTAGCSRVAAPPTAGTCDDECVWAYIYDPVEDKGEFFQYSFEEADDTTNPTLNWIHVGGAATFTNTFDVANKPVIYLLEERHYGLNPDTNMFLLSINRQTPLPLVNQVANFKVGAQLPANASPTTINDGLSGNDAKGLTYLRTRNWQDVQFIQVTITSVDSSVSDVTAIRPDRLQLSSQFYPRNALSQDSF